MVVSEYLGCLNDVFNVYKDDLNKEILLKFKRVSNFNEMDSLNAFITNQLSLRKSREELVSLLQQNFSLLREDAEKKIREFYNNVQIELDINGYVPNWIKKIALHRNAWGLSTLRHLIHDFVKENAQLVS